MEIVQIGDETVDLEDYLLDFFDQSIAQERLAAFNNLYCPTCQVMMGPFSITPSGNFRCDECETVFQEVDWAGDDRVAIRSYPFKCPEKCQGRTLADRVRIHVYDGYYESICVDCGETCYSGNTSRKKAMERLRDVAEGVSDVDQFKEFVESNEFTETIPLSEVQG